MTTRYIVFGKKGRQSARRLADFPDSASAETFAGIESMQMEHDGARLFVKAVKRKGAGRKSPRFY